MKMLDHKNKFTLHFYRQSDKPGSKGYDYTNYALFSVAYVFRDERYFIMIALFMNRYAQTFLHMR